VAVNGLIIWAMFTRLFGESFNRAAQTLQLWTEFLLEALLPTLGVLLELFDLKFARWVNVGYLSLAGFIWLAEAFRWWSDSYHGVLLIVALGLLILAGLTEIIYRSTRNA